MARFSYVPLQNLIIAARAAVEGRPTAAQELQAALRGIDQALQDQEDSTDVIRRARLLASDDLEIDDDPMVSIAEDGVWVSAWVWVSAEKDAA